MKKEIVCALLVAAFLFPVKSDGADPIPATAVPTVLVDTTKEPVAPGKFQPTWPSLKQYQVPDWFRDAKFGIWACFGPQCEAEDGDWYARGMYDTGSEQNKFHLAHYGSPAQFGFKDLAEAWKAQRWDPEKLVALYKRAGARYFVAMANHHDNFDCWDSKYQPWNSVHVGPQKDLVAGWEKAARHNGLRFGVSVHASHAWTWFELARNYDGKLTKAEGAGKWWDGLDPQDLYAQNHERSRNDLKMWDTAPIWNWGNGASRPDKAYCEKFYNRTMDLINRFHPDLLYFDDTALPLWPVSDAGLLLAAHFYNTSEKAHGDNGVLFGKILDAEEIPCMTRDIERGASSQIEPQPFQTDTCIGDWHYDRAIYERHGYKSAATVVQMLADVVSKNGNLLLSIPVRADGTIDDQEKGIVEDIGAWLKVNGEGIFGTRPWKIYGEGPASGQAKPSAQEFSEGKLKPFTAADIRFTTRGNTLYAIVLGYPSNGVSMASLGLSAKLLEGHIRRIQMLGSREKIHWTQNDDALRIYQPKARINQIATIFKITTSS